MPLLQAHDPRDIDGGGVMRRCVVCREEILDGMVCWFDYKLGSMHLECKTEVE